MEVRELRIGNYVYLTKDNFETIKEYQLDAFDIYKLDENECEDIKPIPLTEEWLLKLGGIDKGFIFFKAKRKVIKFEWSSRVVSTGKRYGFKSSKYNNIKYVHQLQNLYFALTGEELTLKKD